MTRCAAIQEDLTAWVDGELSEQQIRVVGDHLGQCGTCADLARQLRAAVPAQRQTLTCVVAIADLDRAELWRRTRSLLVNDVEAPRPRWAWWPRRFALAGLATAAAVGVFVALNNTPQPAPVMVDLGTPPVEVVERPDLFKDYPLIEQLDALENFDTVEAVPLDDDTPSQNG